VSVRIQALLPEFELGFGILTYKLKLIKI